MYISTFRQKEDIFDNIKIFTSPCYLCQRAYVLQNTGVNRYIHPLPPQILAS